MTILALRNARRFKRMDEKARRNPFWDKPGNIVWESASPLSEHYDIVWGPGKVRNFYPKEAVKLLSE